MPEKACPPLRPMSSPEPTPTPFSDTRIPSYYELHHTELLPSPPHTSSHPGQSRLATSSSRTRTNDREDRNAHATLSHDLALLVLSGALSSLLVYALPEGAHGLLSRGTSGSHPDPYAAIYSPAFATGRGGLSIPFILFPVTGGIVWRLGEGRRQRRTVLLPRPFVLRIIVYAVAICLALLVVGIALACTPKIAAGRKSDVAGVEVAMSVAIWVVLVLLDKVMTMAYRDVVSSDRDDVEM